MVFIVLGSGQAAADSKGIDVNVRDQYNKVVEHIYDQFSELKSYYPELRNFSREVLGRDGNGFDKITYRYSQDEYGYQFSMITQEINQSTIDDDAWQLKFPLLGFEVVIRSKRLGESAVFDPSKIVEESFQSLKELEQGYLPFRLELKADKDVYGIKEQIKLHVYLRNMGSHAFKVEGLSEQSLFCQIDNQEWGSMVSTGELDDVLKPKESLHKILLVQGFNVPKEVWITCTYGLGFKGLQPFSRIKVLVQKDQ